MVRGSDAMARVLHSVACIMMFCIKMFCIEGLLEGGERTGVESSQQRLNLASKVVTRDILAARRNTESVVHCGCACFGGC